MAAFLSSGDVICHHEALKRDDYEALMSLPYRLVGNADSMGMFGPEMKTVIVDRPLADVRASLKRMGIVADAFLVQCHQKLKQLDAMRVPFDRIDSELPRICAYLDVPYDHERAKLFNRLNIQTTDLSIASERFNLVMSSQS